MMDAKEARQIAEKSASVSVNAVRDVLVGHATTLIKTAAEGGKRQISNPFQGLRILKSSLDEQNAYAVLEQKGYTVAKLGDSNVIISW